MLCPNCSLKAEEIERLRKRIESLQHNENELLIESLQKQISSLQKENEQLKKEKQHLMERINQIHPNQKDDKKEEEVVDKKEKKKRILSPINKDQDEDNVEKQSKRIRVNYLLKYNNIREISFSKNIYLNI